MSKASTVEIPSALLDILMSQSDEMHPLSMPVILDALEGYGIHTGRQTVYKCIEVLRRYGFEIVYINAYHTKGYCLRHLFTPSESLFLSMMVRESKALSESDKKRLSKKINSLLSSYQEKLMPSIRSSENGNSILSRVEQLLEAAGGHHPVEFLYYDIDVYGKRRYRRNSRKYRLVPYALVPWQNRFYCIFHDPVHRDFASYRIDKMDQIQIDKADSEAEVSFDLERYMQSSFDMYHGQAETVTIRFKRDMSSLLFDQFDQNSIIIQSVDDEYFTASLRTAVTPTLIAWLIMYSDRCTVTAPASLIEKLRQTGMKLMKQYDQKEDL